MIYLQLYWSFIKVGIFCVGGGYASMPLIQQETIFNHHWITMNDLINIFAISQMTPGPIGINAATFVGSKVAGIGGSIAATLGFVTPSVFLMVSFALLMKKYGNLGPIKGILNGIRPAVIALIASAGVMFLTLALWDKEVGPFLWADLRIAELLLLVLAFFFAYIMKMSVIKNMCICGVLALILGYMGVLG